MRGVWFPAVILFASRSTLELAGSFKNMDSGFIPRDLDFVHLKFFLGIMILKRSLGTWM